MIMWEMLLQDENVCEALQRLYSEMGINLLALHLGVSRVALIKKLRECKIETRPRGGPHIRVELDTLADKWWEKSTDELVSITGYCANYVRKLRRKKICSLASSTKTNSPVSPTDTKDSSSE